jgi:hypothetical protein
MRRSTLPACSSTAVSWHSVLWCTALSCLVSVGVLPAVPARGQVLVDTLSAAAAQQNLQAGNAGNAKANRRGNQPAPAPAAARSDTVGFGGTKYIPAYVLVLMLVALGAFIICRPGNRHDPA